MSRAPKTRRECPVRALVELSRGGFRRCAWVLEVRLKLILVLMFLTIIPSVNCPIASLRLEDDFSTDAALKASVLREFPQWDSFPDFEKVDVLRHWAAQRIDVSSSSLFLTNNESFHFLARTFQRSSARSSVTKEESGAAAQLGL
jgi:hypothetical protein